MDQNLKFFIITGEPGVGKTTLTKKIFSTIANQGVEVQGFYTEEVKNNGIREGFDVVTLDGKRGRLAREQNSLRGLVKYKVGKYAVLKEEFENIALPSLERTSEDTGKYLLVIDEIGKMEFFSEAFKSVMRNLFVQTSEAIVLATIPVKSTDKFISCLRNDTRAKVWMVTKENRNKIHEDILNEMKTVLPNIS